MNALLGAGNSSGQGAEILSGDVDELASHVLALIDERGLLPPKRKGS
jgi:hypothetical protein